MKFFFHILLCVMAIPASVSSCNAQDIKAGEMSIHFLSGNTYQIDTQIYYDSAYFIDRPIILYYGDGNSAVVSGNIGNPNAAIIKKQYSTTHIYPGSGVYIISVIDSFRIANIQNISNSSNKPFALIDTLVINPFLGSNNSPVSVNPPIDNYVCCNWFYNSGAVDPDGDSLAYHLTAPSLVSNYSFPPASVNGITGDISFSPSQIGLYEVGLTIKEWRKATSNGYWIIGTVFRDMLFEVASLSNVNEQQTSEEIIIFPNPANDFCTIQNVPKKAVLQIQNVLGQIVKRISTDTPTVKIDMRNFPQGIYFLRIIVENSIVCKKIIIG